MWSLGCIFIQMITGNHPFKAQSKIDILFKIFQLIGTPKDEHFSLKLDENQQSQFGFNLLKGHHIIELH